MITHKLLMHFSACCPVLVSAGSRPQGHDQKISASASPSFGDSTKCSLEARSRQQNQRQIRQAVPEELGSWSVLLVLNHPEALVS
jgi:hypothetical protein